MKKCHVLSVFKGMIGVFAFVLISAGFIGSAKADTISAIDNKPVEVTGAESIDMNTVMKALDGKSIVDGEQIPINDEYVAICEVNLTKPSSFASNTNTDGLDAYSATNTTTNYVGSCNIYIMHFGTDTMVAYINHTVNITYYDTGLVHINSGSLNSTPLYSYVSTYAYGYQINNTNGSYSSANGTVRLYDATTSSYYYYGCGVSVTPGNQPSFSFIIL